MMTFWSFSFTIGATLGSFLKTCIYRLPAGFSVVKPRSRCQQMKFLQLRRSFAFVCWPLGVRGQVFTVDIPMGSKTEGGGQVFTFN